jgi:hypothetical protein
MRDIALALGLTENELFHEALVAFLRERKRQTLQLRLEILSRYAAESTVDLESKIVQGAVAEHPAWEDLITIENLDKRLKELDDYLARLSSSKGDRTQ